MEFIIPAIVLGCLYCLLAVGFVVIYRSSRILNFAYADVVMLAGYFTVSMTQLLAVPTSFLFVIILILGFLFGTVIYVSLIRQMAGQPIFSTIILTVCIGIVLRSVTILFWGGEVESIPFDWDAYYSFPARIRVSSNEILLVLTTILFYIALFSFYRYSKLGQQMRATAESALLASQRGVNIHLVTAIAWGIGIFASALAAIFLGGNYGVSLHMGHVALKAFAVALVGGLDSIPGTIPAAFIIAMTEIGVSSYISPRVADAVPFIIMMIILLFRPWGFFGTEEEIERI